jgi:penicillin-binding protein 1C
MSKISRIKLGGALLAIMAFSLCGGILAFLPPTPDFPEYDRVRSGHRKSESRLLDRNGQIIHEMRVDPRVRRLDWVPLAEISPALRRAVVCAEDRRFFRHHGVDWLSLAGAAVNRFNAGNLRGASTITMQVASKLRRELQPASGRRSMRQKWQQIRSARALERRWPKEQILEAYLNLVTFRGELQGVAAAAGGLFQKQPHGLSDLESIILAALVRAPNAAADQVARRARLLGSELSAGASAREIESLAREVLSRPYLVRPQAALAPHVAARLIARDSAATEVASTLDGGLQRFATEALRRQVMALKAQNVRDGAILVAENDSGDVLAYVGNPGSNPAALYVDGVQARRQAGSTLKPFLYAVAIERRLLTAASLIEDRPLDLPVGGGIYRPQNYDNRFYGAVTPRAALASSLNVPAVRTLSLVGVEPFVERLEALGFAGLRSSEYYGPSLALGAADVTLWELVSAYRCLANHGSGGALRLAPAAAPEPSRRVYTPEAAFIVSDILSDRESRGRTFSLESPLATRFWTAVKTGTSQDMRDNWCVGYSSRYTVGVWAGNFSGEPMWNVSGVSGAAPAWVEVMNYLHRDSTSGAPVPPAPLRKSGNEWFIAGTEPAGTGGPATAGHSRILYPADGTVIAYDPDIPADDQMLFFEADPASESLRWLLNGRDIGSAGALRLWPPRRGAHSLTLADSTLRPLDTITFQVR